MNDGKFRLGLIKMTNNDVIPEDEPVFILRGRDHLAVRLLEQYAVMCHEDGCTDYQLKGVASGIRRFKKFRKDHPGRMKQPGVTGGL